MLASALKPTAVRALKHSQPSDGPELVGKVIDQRFRVLSHIGSGGMADVYEVEHVTLGRKLALKVLRRTAQSNPSLTRRFSREARALSRITSEHVVSIFDYGILPDGFPFFVMDLLRGRTLRAVLDAEHELTVVRTCNLGIDVCFGLTAAHQVGLVHRDLKPENLWQTRRDDGREACVLLDFGVAQVEGAHTTSDGVLVGTARYMSPEQIRSGAAPGPESDVFALGIVLYECLCGVAPFAADSLERTLFRIMNEAPRPIQELAEEVPRELVDVLGRALSKQRSERYPTALELARALLPFAGPLRQLHGLQIAGHSVESNDTLPEDESKPPLLADVENDAAPAMAKRPMPLWLRWGSWLAVFLLGLALGGFVLHRAPAAAAGAEALARAMPATAPSSEQAAAGEALLAPGTPSALSPLSSGGPPTGLGAQSGTLTRRSHPATSQKPPDSAPPPSSERPLRLDPPQPSFDGRNPYLP